MKKIDEICRKYKIALCYLFGSRQNEGRAILEGKRVCVEDPKQTLILQSFF